MSKKARRRPSWKKDYFSLPQGWKLKRLDECSVYVWTGSRSVRLNHNQKLYTSELKSFINLMELS